MLLITFQHGRTALHISAHRGFLDIVRVLLQAGCDPDIQDDVNVLSAFDVLFASLF